MDNHTKEVIDRILKRCEPGDVLSVSYLYALLLANPGRYGVPDVRSVPDLRTFEAACAKRCKTVREFGALSVEIPVS